MKISTTKFLRPCTSSVTTTKHDLNIRKFNKNPKMKIQAPKSLHHDRNISLFPVSTPPVRLSKKWKECQGIKNWQGLLDPLDENLRCEIIRYGNFVEAAYRSCDFDPSSSSYAMCLYPKNKLLNESDFICSGYKVTKNLIATSGIQLPKWIERAPDWVAMQSSWIGYVAVCRDRKEIARLGRRDVVIAFRGTATCLEWLENLRATLTPLRPNKNSNSGPMVESGFLSLYTSSIKTRPSLQNLIREEVSRILKKYGNDGSNEPLSFTITGHSLGAALATLAAYDIKKTFKNSPLVTVISFAGPRVGNWAFGSYLEENGVKVLRIVNSDDVITKVPGFVVDNNNEGTRFSDNPAAAQWVYADVGCELRLSSRDSPYLNGINIATCHELKTYLHLVNGFVSSNCPFRATARKMMNETLGN
ncbi:hypothetical protein ACJIZ3_007794 [Penstemon smallii]|uniref:Fungal lipase-type domain-containing protein n=1 Tax=Penstemon smallii TaxID=265156 RepID=A0ABD3T9W6_9LAMI